MKKFLMITAISIAVISCSDKNKKGGSKSTDSYKGLYGDSVNVPYITDSLSARLDAVSEIAYNLFQQVNQHGISFREAVQLIAHYNSAFNSTYGGRGIAGCIPISSIENLPEPAQDRVSGMVYFMCYDSKDQANPADDEVFLAYRGVSDFDYGPDYYRTQFLDTDEFEISTNIVRNSMAGPGAPPIDTIVMRRFLEGPIQYTATNPSVLKYEKVKVLNEEYIREIAGCVDPLNHARTVACTEIACGFFETGALKGIINQADPAGLKADAIRFFFGYDPTLDKNKIRVVCMGATPTQNLLYVTNGGIYMYSNYVERSWP